MNAVTKTDQPRTKSVTQWSELSLPDNLDRLLDQNQILMEMPVVGPKTAGQLQAFVDQPRPPQVQRHQIDTMLGKLSLALPKAKISEAEAEERLEVYWQGLRHHALPDLHQAFTSLLRTCRFFPTVAEIESAVAPFRWRRESRLAHARLLVFKHKKEWTPPIPDEEKADPVEVAELSENLRIGEGAR